MKFATVILLLGFFSCHQGKHLIQATPEIRDTTKNLYAFVGEKIWLTEFDPNDSANIPIKTVYDSSTKTTETYYRAYVMDHAFNARYKVLFPVYNDLEMDTIDFKVFDHYGRPGFDKVQYVLLYISKSADNRFFVHQKYQFDPLIKTGGNSFTGIKGESLTELFIKKRNEVFTERQIF